MKNSLCRNSLFYTVLVLSVSLYPATRVYCQLKKSDTLIAAGAEYAKPRSYTKLWGERYRAEWTTPIKAPIVYLDTAFGGLSVYKAGGGKQTLSLRLRDKKDHEFAIRSINKQFARTAPESVKGTFVENLVADLTSIMHPYAPITVPVMAEKAGIYYAPPRIAFIPYQSTLDSFNKQYGNRLYWLEPRPDENWEGASNFGNSSNIVATDKLIEKLKEENDHRIDYKFYVKTRLFDMFIGDWDRHEDQWRWATEKKDGETIYRPIPRDRDMVYSKFEGFLLKFSIKAAGLFYLQSFDHKIKDVETYNFEERFLDRFLANQASLEDWQTAASELQQSLTDTVIAQAVRQMPAEVFNLSGPSIISMLKSRRDKLHNYARQYYLFLAKEVDVRGSQQSEYFKVERLDDERTRLQIFDISKEGLIKNKPFYDRVFKNDETKELRIYGLDGNDSYDVTGNVNSGLKLRIVAGIGADSVRIDSRVSGLGNKNHLYDNPGNFITGVGEVKKHISSDTSINSFNYYGYSYNREGFKPMFFFSNADRLYAGISYSATIHKWRKSPYAQKHKVDLNYSFSQKAPSIWYKGIFPQTFGNWALVTTGFFDAVRWLNFYGLGNETKREDTANSYYRTRMQEWSGIIGIEQRFLKHHFVNISGFVSGNKVLKDSGVYFHKFYQPSFAATDYQAQQFAGAYAAYEYYNLDNDIVPSRGFAFAAKVTYTQNLKYSNKNFIRLDGNFKWYLPITSHIVYSMRAGASTVNGQAEFYQLPWIGGAQYFRGFRRERFYGKSVVYNNNDLQWETNFRSKLLSGKIGLLALFDNGRVWIPGEKSNTWHTSVGGGIMIAPFNLVMATLTYAVSSDGGTIQIRLNKDL